MLKYSLQLAVNQNNMSYICLGKPGRLCQQPTSVIVT